MNGEIIKMYDGTVKYRLVWSATKQILKNQYNITAKYYETNLNSNISKAYSYGSFIKINSQYSSSKTDEKLIDTPYNQEILKESCNMNIVANNVGDNEIIISCGHWNYEGLAYKNIPDTKITLERLSNSRFKINNIWKNSFAWIKLLGEWKRAIVWKKINGVWKKGK